MVGFPVQSASLGLGGILIFHSPPSSGGTTIWKAMEVPLGDHAMFEGESVTRLIWLTAPSASIQRTKSWVPPDLPGARKAMRVPSGDHLGDDPSTRNRFFFPSTFIIQREDSQLSFTASTHLRV